MGEKEKKIYSVSIFAILNLKVLFIKFGSMLPLLTTETKELSPHYIYVGTAATLLSRVLTLSTWSHQTAFPHHI